MSSKSRARTEQLEFRRCLGAFPTGVTVVTYDTPDGRRGATVNSFVSVSLDPALVLVSIGAGARARTGLEGAPFAVNILGAHQSDVAVHFAGRPSDALRVPWQAEASVPRLRECAAWLECLPWRSVEAGDHTLFIGEVVAFGHDPSAAPLIFHAGVFADKQSNPPHARRPSLAERLDRRRDFEIWSDAGVTSSAVPA
ncbi:flavin reductase family protein [Pseudonocardia xishanensis]|uniref:Flavin reductase like domain-containing protein n=1 Tax=Pseudonocardia xishanensis TaxID=630995 RepID=A0ABP8S3Y1_9PSEU